MTYSATYKTVHTLTVESDDGPDSKPTKFGELETGDKFIAEDGALCMKVALVNIPEEYGGPYDFDVFNTVDLLLGELTYTDDEELVSRCTNPVVTDTHTRTVKEEQ